MDRPQPLIFNAWMTRFYDGVLRSNGVLRGGGRGAAAPWPTLVPAILEGQSAALCGSGCDAQLASSLQDALHELVPRFGPDVTQWHWGAAHEAVFAHPLLRFLPVLGPLTEARIAQPGDDTTLDRGGMAGDNFTSVHGASFRGVYDLADLDRSLFVVAPGQSGHIASQLARNFVQRWRDGDTVTIGPTPSRVDVTLHLTPAVDDKRD